jgi:hypothetical protein
MSDDDDEDFDSIFASKGNHASKYINAISQAASVAVINLFFYFQLSLLEKIFMSWRKGLWITRKDRDMTWSAITIKHFGAVDPKLFWSYGCLLCCG